MRKFYFCLMLLFVSVFVVSAMSYGQSNVALNKTYTLSPNSGEGVYADTGGELTNGVSTVIAEQWDPIVGFYNVDPVVILDLGSIKSVEKVELYFFFKAGGAFSSPLSCKFLYSPDGNGYTSFGATVTSYETVTGDTYKFVRTTTPVDARYIKFNVTRQNNWTAISEVMVYVSSSATKLAFVQQPSDTQVNLVMTPPVTVQLKDASNNNVLTSGVSIHLSLSSGTGVLSGTVDKLTDSSGLATFSDLSIDQLDLKNLTASSAGLTYDISNSFNITSLPATQLVVVQGTSDTVVNSVMVPSVTVQLKDASNNNVLTSGVTVNVALSSGSGSLSGTVSVVTNASGIATFSDLSVDQIGVKSLIVSSSGLTSAVTNSFNVTSSSSTSATQLVVVQGTSDTVVNSVMTPPVTVQLRDASNNNVLTSGVTVNVALSGSGSLSGTLQRLTDSSGIATFSDLRVDQIGVKSLTISSSGLTSAVTNSFNVTSSSFTPTPMPTLTPPQVTPTPFVSSFTPSFGGLVYGRVINKSEYPLSEIKVIYSTLGNEYLGKNPVLTDNDGYYYFYDVDTQYGYGLVMSGQRYGSVSSSFNGTNKDSLVFIPDTMMLRGNVDTFTLSGVVRDTSSNPISNARVRVKMFDVPPRFTFTDSLGAFSVPNLLVGTHTVIVRRGGYYSERVRYYNTDGLDGNIDIELREK